MKALEESSRTYKALLATLAERVAAEYWETHKMAYAKQECSRE